MSSTFRPGPYDPNDGTPLPLQESPWQPIETAPKDTKLLLWWVPVDGNKYAESAVIGTVSYHEPGTWWDGQRGEYQTLSHIRYWMPLPPPPEPKK